MIFPSVSIPMFIAEMDLGYWGLEGGGNGGIGYKRVVWTLWIVFNSYKLDSDKVTLQTDVIWHSNLYKLVQDDLSNASVCNSLYLNDLL